MRIARLPGVFRPRSDTWLLAAVLRRQPQLRGGAVLDVCTGSGAIAVAAALAGARSVTAVDLSARAVLTTRLNARLNGVRVRGAARRPARRRPRPPLRRDRLQPAVPAERGRAASRARRRAPHRGRRAAAGSLLDRLIDAAPAHLAPGGLLLVTHSSVNGEAETLDRMRAAGPGARRRRAPPRRRSARSSPPARPRSRRRGMLAPRRAQRGPARAGRRGLSRPAAV